MLSQFSHGLCLGNYPKTVSMDYLKGLYRLHISCSYSNIEKNGRFLWLTMFANLSDVLSLLIKHILQCFLLAVICTRTRANIQVSNISSTHLQSYVTELYNVSLNDASSFSEYNRSKQRLKFTWVSIKADTYFPKMGISLYLGNNSNLLTRNGGGNSSTRFRRQVVPLAKPVVKLPLTGESLSEEVQMKMELYKNFLVDYSAKVEWTSVRLLVPHQSFPVICDYFVLEMILSNASVTVNCSNELLISYINTPGHKKPVIIADFLNVDINHGSPIDPQLLMNYTPRRQIVVLAGNVSVRELLTKTQPETQRNYKWTLIKQPENSSLNAKALEIYHVFGFSSSPYPLAERIGMWNDIDRLAIDATNFTGLVDFEDRIVRVTTVQGAPVVNLEKTTNKSILASGYLPDIFDSLALLLNFEFQILTPADGKFGDLDQQGNWSGMVGMLQRNEADVALMSFSFTKSRLAAMDFSPPVEYSSTRLLIRRDWQISELKWDAFFRPFEWKVWVSIPILIGLGATTLVFFSKFKLYEAHPAQSIWLLSTCFLLQGQSEHSAIRLTSYRIAMGTFWILAVFIFACYTARLTSFLAAETDKMPVQNLAEAVKSKAWRVGLTKGSSFIERVKESGAEEMKLLWKRLQDDSSVLVSGFQEGIDKVYKERFIFFTSEQIPAFAVKGNCSYTWLPGKYFPGFGYMGYQNDLPYASSMSRIVAKLRETGQMRRLYKKWWGTESTCSARATGDAFMAISLLETGSAFIILIVGASLSVFFMAVEFLARATQDNWQTHELNQQFSDNEFAAPIVHGAFSNFLPHLAQDKSFIWSMKEKPLQIPQWGHTGPSSGDVTRGTK